MWIKEEIFHEKDKMYYIIFPEWIYLNDRIINWKILKIDL